MSVVLDEPRDLASFDGTTIRGREAVLADLPALIDVRVALLGDPVRVTRTVRPLSDVASHLKVFQHEGVWVLPRLAGILPGVARDLTPASLRISLTTRLAEANRRRDVPDGWTRRQLEPPAPPHRRTVVYSDGYFGALRRPEVELITWPIAGIVPAGLRTADGLEHHVDVIVLV